MTEFMKIFDQENSEVPSDNNVGDDVEDYIEKENGDY